MSEQREEVTEHAATYHRHGDLDPSGWEAAPTVTDRPSDEAGENSTLASRAAEAAASRKRLASKAVKADDDEVEDKAVSSAQTKGRARRK